MRIRARAAMLALSAAISAATAAPAHSQNRIPTPNPLQTLPEARPPQPAPAVNTRIQAHENAALAELMSTRVTPQRFELSGVGALDAGQVGGVFQPLVGRTVAVADIVAAADACTARYRQAGFALSFCFVPAQDFADGVVRIVAVEGYVARVEIDGDAGKLERRMRAVARRITTDRPLRQATFERYSQILGFLPGASLSLDVPPPGTTDGATTLRIRVDRRRVADASLALELNRPGVQELVTGTLNAPTSLAGQWSLSALYPRGRDDQRFYALGYSQMLGSDGLVGRADVSTYRGEPRLGGLLGDVLRREVEQDRAAMSLRHPLSLRGNRALLAGMTFYGTRQVERYRNVETGAQLEQSTDTRVVGLGLDYVSSSGRGSRQASLSLARGVDGGGAGSRVRTNVPGPALLAPDDVSFTRYNLAASQDHAWGDRITAVGRVEAQYSRDRLPTSEQISFGGPRFGLAYDPGETTGDRGWGASVEVSHGFERPGRAFASLAPYVLVQHAQVDVVQGVAPLDRLGSAAVGLRVSDQRRYSVDMALARPTGDLPPGARDRDPRWSLTLSYRLP